MPGECITARVIETLRQVLKPHMQRLRAHLVTGGKPSETSRARTALWPALPSPAFAKLKEKLFCNYIEMTGLVSPSHLCSVCQNWRVLASGTEKLFGRPNEQALLVLKPLPHGHKHFCLP